MSAIIAVSVRQINIKKDYSYVELTVCCIFFLCEIDEITLTKSVSGSKIHGNCDLTQILGASTVVTLGAI